jgi:hypothetical protein
MSYQKFSASSKPAFPCPKSAGPDIVVTEDMYAPRSDYFVATFGDFDLDCLTGRGHTPLDAIVDLLDKAEG